MQLKHVKHLLALLVPALLFNPVYAEDTPTPSLILKSSFSTGEIKNAGEIKPAFPTAESAHETLAAPDAQIEVEGSEPVTIINIESAPSDALPLLKALNDVGNPQQDLWERIRVGFALPALDTNLVFDNAEWYAQRPEYVARMLERSKRYLFYIVQEVEKRGMPTEVALLPMVESAFNPKAYSVAKASGLWQFIPSTGRSYGLQQNWWVDNRRDVIAATRAALDYLQKLHGMFGDWHLALAAYNWGEGSVQRAIAKNQAKGLPTDYLSLRMPRETQNYVPRLLAVKKLIQKPQDFNADLGVLPNTPYFAQITLSQHIDVALAAKLAETSLEEFTALNPNYTRPVIQAKQPTALLLPVDKAELFSANLENYEKPLVSWRPYHAKRGEKVAAIASRYGISIGRLTELNSLQHRRGRLTSNQIVLVPGSGASNAANDIALVGQIQAAAASEKVERGEIYTVRKGDTLLAIAKRHGVKAEQIKAWNNLSSNKLALNQKLRIGAAEKTAAKTEQRTKVAVTEVKPRNAKPASKQKQYTVKRGDTLYSIAQRFDVDLDDLKRWNKLTNKSRLHPGDKVTILAKNG